MTIPAKPAATLADLLPRDLALGEPDVAGPLVVFPVLAAQGALEYRSFAEATALGFGLHELDPPSVGDLRASNPLDAPVLLFEGEEVRGAQQDRTVDVTVLVEAGGEVRIPVSCVEQGRWDGTRHGEAFAPSPDLAFPALRAAKSRHARLAAAAGREARADQGEVWRTVGERGGGASETGAMSGAFAAHEDEVAQLERAVSRRDGQVGALACIGGRPAVLDLLSRSDVFAALFRPLVRGYCLDAVQQADGGAGDPDTAGFLRAAGELAVARRPSPGMGEAVHGAGAGAGASGLVVGDELVQLSVFAEQRPTSRILRPSRRR